MALRRFQGVARLIPRASMCLEIRFPRWQRPGETRRPKVMASPLPATEPSRDHVRATLLCLPQRSPGHGAAKDCLPPRVPNPLPPPGNVLVMNSVLAGSSIGGLCALHALHETLDPALAPITLVTGSLGASAALIFAAPDLPFAQPRNVVGGHVVSATIGSILGACASTIGGGSALASPFAVGIAIAAMLRARVFHPPAAGTAIIAVQTTLSAMEHGASVQHAVFFAAIPPSFGATILVAMGVVLNSHGQAWIQRAIAILARIIRKEEGAAVCRIRKKVPSLVERGGWRGGYPTYWW